MGLTASPSSESLVDPSVGSSSTVSLAEAFGPPNGSPPLRGSGM